MVLNENNKEKINNVKVTIRLALTDLSKNIILRLKCNVRNKCF